MSNAHALDRPNTERGGSMESGRSMVSMVITRSMVTAVTPVTRTAHRADLTGDKPAFTGQGLREEKEQKKQECWI